MSAPAAKARVPAPVRTIARQRRVGVERGRARRRARRAGRSSSALRTSGRSIVTSATPSTGPVAASGAGNATLTRRRSAGWAVSVGAVWVKRSSVRAHSSSGARREAAMPGTGASHGARLEPDQPPARVLEDEERREPRRDLAQVPAGLAHRVGARPASSAARSSKSIAVDQDEIGLAAERLGRPAGRASRAGPASGRRAAGAPRGSGARTSRAPRRRRRAGGTARAGSSSGASSGCVGGRGCEPSLSVPGRQCGARRRSARPRERVRRRPRALGGGRRRRASAVDRDSRSSGRTRPAPR